MKGLISTDLFPDEYVVIDTETTGFSSTYDSMLEIGALRVKNGEVIDEFHSFVKYDNAIPNFIVELTGITNDMIQNAPADYEAAMKVKEFIGTSFIVGYNTKFDINFINDALSVRYGLSLDNHYVDCLRYARKLFPDFKHHRLKDMADHYNIERTKEHRATHDCLTTIKVFEALKGTAIEKYGSIDAFIKAIKYHKPKLDARTLSAENIEFDVTHPLYGKSCVFTGTLERMQRKEAMQAVINVGGKVENGVTNNTNYLILGNNDYCSTIKDGKSSKQKKAENLMLKGNDIAIIPENVFYDMLDYE